MDHIKLIKNESDHEAALARLMSLVDQDPQPGSAEADEIDVLAVLIEQYERETFPIEMPDPIDAIVFRMEQKGLANKDLMPFIGSASKVSEVLNRKRPLSLNMIRKLVSGLGIPAEILIQDPKQKAAISADVEWRRFPLSDMRKGGYFEGFDGSLQELKEYAAERVSSFISSVTNGFNLKPALLRTSAHLISNDKETNEYALWAWQIKVLKEAERQEVVSEYVEGTVNLAWMQKLAKLSWSEQGPIIAIEYLNKEGIRLVIEPHLPKTYLDGAVCKTDQGHPVVALTLRYDRLDNFWFSLMHELAHIALHLDGSESWYLDNMDVKSADTHEMEADALAKEALIPESEWVKKGSLESAYDVINFAKELSISPCIVAGRDCFESGQYNKFGAQFKEKVRYLFE